MFKKIRNYLGYNIYNKKGFFELVGKVLRLWFSNLNLMCYYIGIFKPSRKLQFLCIGAQKAGTTWLHKVFSDSNCFSLGNEKESHFFDLGFNFTLGSFLKQLDISKFTGEIAPDYAALPVWKIKLIKKLWPELKVFMIVRNPIERSLSAAKMDIVNVGKMELTDNLLLDYVNSKKCLNRSDYFSIIEKWEKVLKNDVRIFFYDDLLTDGERFLDDISLYLIGKKIPFSAAKDERIHESVKSNYDFNFVEHYLRDKYTDYNQRFLEHYNRNELQW